MLPAAVYNYYADGTGRERTLRASTRSTRKIEDVAAAVRAEGGRWWFQVYIMRDRSLTEDLVRRAAGAGAGALVLTGDTPVVGRKPRDRGDVVGDASDVLVNLGPLPDRRLASQAADVTFADIRWLAGISGLPVVVKGVLRGDDALACADAGASAVIVSNHGGRQLDGALPAAWALPDVAAALRGPAGIPACVDGGIRARDDVLAALPSAPRRCSWAGRSCGHSPAAERPA